MGYLDFAWFAALTARGVWCVTRLKENTAYRVVAQRDVPTRGPVCADEVIQLTGPRTAQKHPGLLRRVQILVPETGEPLTFLTNHFDFGPTTIARIYKDRWAALLRMNLLVYRDLWTWLEHPFSAPPVGPPDPVQVRLPLGTTWTAAPGVSS